MSDIFVNPNDQDVKEELKRLKLAAIKKGGIIISKGASINRKEILDEIEEITKKEKSLSSKKNKKKS